MQSARRILLYQTFEAEAEERLLAEARVRRQRASVRGDDLRGLCVRVYRGR